MKNHWLWMIIACAVPLLVIFMLPVLGVQGGGSLFFLIILMFIAHLFMMDGHDHEGNGETKKDREAKHEHH